MDHFQRLHESLVSDCQWVFFALRWQNTIMLDFPTGIFLVTAFRQTCHSLLSLNRAPGSGIRLGLVRSSSASYSASISVGVRRAVPDLVLTTFEWLARRSRLGKVDKLG